MQAQEKVVGDIRFEVSVEAALFIQDGETLHPGFKIDFLSRHGTAPFQVWMLVVLLNSQRNAYRYVYLKIGRNAYFTSKGLVFMSFRNWEKSGPKRLGVIQQGVLIESPAGGGTMLYMLFAYSIYS
jgi:hypothetical protein